MDPALHQAAVHGSVASLRRLGAERPGILGSKTPHGNTALHIAAELGHAGFTEEALGVGEKLFVSWNADGDTPLHLAAGAGKVDVVELLISRASAWPEEEPQHSPAESARGALFMTNNIDLAYKRNRDRQSPLHVAACWSRELRRGLDHCHRRGREAMVELLKQCPDVAEMVDSNGRNAFDVAITCGRVDALRCLLKHVRPEEIFNRVDHQGNTPLHLAASLRRNHSTFLLIKDKDRRVNPCVLNRDGESARSLIEKRATTEELDTYEMYMWKKLSRHEANRCKSEQLPPLDSSLWLRRQRVGRDEFNVTTLTDGTAIHANKTAFKIFLFSNTVAMCSSVVVVFCPIMWAWQDSELKLGLAQLILSRRLTNVAFLAMILSFVTAVYITIAPTVRWPAYVVIAIVASTPALVACVHLF
ncbi:hypothetical protein VPH35_114332 [Triticum aestivum]